MPQNIALTSEPLIPEKIIPRRYKAVNGAVVSFVGTVRQYSNSGEKISELEIIPLDGAQKKLEGIAGEIAGRWPIDRADIYIHRRCGRLKVGEIALVAAVCGVHRQEAFAACAHIIDRIKAGGITAEKDIPF